VPGDHRLRQLRQADDDQLPHRSAAGSFAYITGVLPGGERILLCRLRYGGSAYSFGFAIYSAARGSYDDTVLRTGLPAGTPQEALDTACTIHLAGLGHEPAGIPPANLRSHPQVISLNTSSRCGNASNFELVRKLRSRAGRSGGVTAERPGQAEAAAQALP
jgi:hypothetical protein